MTDQPEDVDWAELLRAFYLGPGADPALMVAFLKALATCADDDPTMPVTEALLGALCWSMQRDRERKAKLN